MIKDETLTFFELRMDWNLGISLRAQRRDHLSLCVHTLGILLASLLIRTRILRFLAINFGRFISLANFR